LIEACVVELLRRGNDEIGIGQVRRVEKRNCSGGFARQVDGGKIVVNRVGVIVPHAHQLLLRVSDRRIVAVVVGLIILRGNISHVVPPIADTNLVIRAAAPSGSLAGLPTEV